MWFNKSWRGCLVCFLPAGGAVGLVGRRAECFVLEARLFHHPETAFKMRELAESNKKFKAANCC